MKKIELLISLKKIHIKPHIEHLNSNIKNLNSKNNGNPQKTIFCLQRPHKDPKTACLPGNG